MDDALHIWTITYRPRDLPGIKYAARCHKISRNSVEVSQDPPLTAHTLDEIRAKLPPGLTNIGRSAQDDKVIVESWV